jgi:hypothetical protein
VAARPQLASGSGTKLLECRTFQTVEVTFAGSRLLKNMLRHFQRRDGLADHEASIRDNFVQRLPHNGDRRGIKFLFHIAHGRFIERFCKGEMKRARRTQLIEKCCGQVA